MRTVVTTALMACAMTLALFADHDMRGARLGRVPPNGVIGVGAGDYTLACRLFVFWNIRFENGGFKSATPQSVTLRDCTRIWTDIRLEGIEIVSNTLYQHTRRIH